MSAQTSAVASRWSFAQALMIGLASILSGFTAVFIAETGPVILFVAAIAAFIFTIQRPDIGLYVLAFISYLNLSDIAIEKYDAPSIAKFTAAGLIAAVLLRWALFAVRPGGARASFLILGLLWAAASASLLYADYPDQSHDAVERLTKDILFALLVLMIAVDGTVLRRLAWVLILTGAVMGAVTTHQFFTESFDSDYFGLGKGEMHQIVGEVADFRATGPLADPNMYGQILLLLVPLAADRMVADRNIILRAAAGVALLACVLAIVFTFSRGALLGLIGISVVFLARFLRRPRALLTVTMIILLTLPIVPASYVARLEQITDSSSSTTSRDDDQALEGRRTEMLVALHMFLDHPIVGVGLDNYPKHFQPYVQRLNFPPRHEDRKAHSLYLQIAAERGLVGIALFGALIFLAVRSILHGRRLLIQANRPELASLAVSIGISLLGYGISATFLHAEYGRYFWIVVGMALCVRGVAERESRANAPERRSLSPKEVDNGPNTPA